MSTKLGHFDPFSGRSSFNRGRRLRPPTLYTRRPGRRRTSRRSCLKNFPASRRRTRPDRAGEGCGGRKLGLSDFCVFRPSQADPYLISTIFGPSKLISVVPFADSSPFERYDKNKVGRLLDRVFRPPQQLLDQGEGTDVFLVSWAFH